MPPRRIKRLLQACLFLFLLGGGVLVAAFLLSPWWLPVVGQKVAPRYGVTLSEAQSPRYGQMVLGGLCYQSEDGATVTAERITLPSPPGWLAWKLFSQGSAQVRIEHLVVELAPSGEAPAGETPDPVSVPLLLQRGLEANQLAGHYIEGMALDRARIRFSGQEIAIRELHWDGQTASWIAAYQSYTLDFKAELQPQEISLKLALPAHPATLQAEARVEDAGDAATLEAALQNGASRLTAEAEWAAWGYLPSRARIHTTDFRIPPEVYPDYSDQLEGTLSLDADWANEHYQLRLKAQAQTAFAEVPPLQAQIQASGSLQSLNLEKLVVDGSWLQVQLSHPVQIDFDQLENLPDAELHLRADFDEQHIAPLRGQFSADLAMEHRPGELPLFSADWQADALAYAAHPAIKVSGQTVLDWPALHFREVIASTLDGSAIRLQAGGDLQTREVSQAEASGHITIALAESFGLSGIDFQSLDFTAQASGPVEALEHSGKAQLADALIGEDRFNGELSWQGRGTDFDPLHISGSGTQASFNLASRLTLQDDNLALFVSQLEILVPGYADLSLLKPFELRVGTEANLQLSPLQLASSAGGYLQAEAALQWPQSGSLQLSAGNISSAWLGLFIKTELPFPLKLETAQINLDWDESPLNLAFSTALAGGPTGQSPFQLQLALSSDGASTRIDRLSLTQAGEVMVSAEGNLPLALNLAEANPLQLDTEAPLAFQLRSEPEAVEFWHWIEQQAGLELDAPYLECTLHGSLQAPEGSLRAGFSQVTFLQPETELPPISDCQFVLQFLPEQITLEHFALKIAGKPLTASARLPMSPEQWQELASHQVPPGLEALTAQMDFVDVPLEAFAKMLPDVIRPRGQFSLQGRLEPGLRPSGQLTIQDLETRPIAPVGAVSGIEAELELQGRTVKVRRAVALVGGRNVEMSGTVDLNQLDAPVLDLAINGRSVPFVRSPGLIIRGSPDVTIKTGEDGRTTVAGDLLLNESFFTLDLAALTAGGGGGGATDESASRFPYFSINDAPMRDWLLELKVKGDEFMRIRTPVFEGIASANFDLRGTLLEPFAFGQAALNQGVILFPFATFRVQQGTVTVTRDDPYAPQLNVTATGRAYGYDITLRLSGTPDDPQLVFSSTPSLEQGDILLMVTAGRVPDSDRSSESRLAGLGVFIGNTLLVEMGLIDPLDDSLEVLIGEDITETGRDTIKIIYRIDAVWSVVGQYDRFDAYTLDAHYLIYED